VAVLEELQYSNIAGEEGYLLLEGSGRSVPPHQKYLPSARWFLREARYMSDNVWAE
jgi:hypothetical protein